MSDLSEETKKEIRTVAATPILFGVALVVIVALVWGFMHWSYRSVLSGKDAHIASLERRLADYRDALAGAPPDEARRRIEALQNEIKTLRIRLAPRRLDAGQRQSIADRSRRPAGVAPRSVTVLVEDPCSDCSGFGTELAQALQANDNWVATTETVKSLAERPRLGIAVRVPDPTRPPQEAAVLQQSLRSAGIAFTVMPSGVAGGGVELVVSERAP